MLSSCLSGLTIHLQHCLSSIVCSFLLSLTISTTHHSLLTFSVSTTWILQCIISTHLWHSVLNLSSPASCFHHTKLYSHRISTKTVQQVIQTYVGNISTLLASNCVLVSSHNCSSSCSLPYSLIIVKLLTESY